MFGLCNIYGYTPDEVRSMLLTDIIMLCKKPDEGTVTTTDKGIVAALMANAQKRRLNWISMHGG